MSSDEGILRHLLGVLLISQQLMNHRVDPVPIARDHLVEGSAITALKAVHQNTVKGHFLSFRRHTFNGSLMGVLFDCSHNLRQGFAMDATDSRVKAYTTACMFQGTYSGEQKKAWEGAQNFEHPSADHG